MKKTILAMSLAFMFIGCGGGSSSDDTGGTTPPPPEENTTLTVYNVSLINGTASFKTYNGSGVVVGIIDTGYEMTHNEFAGLNEVARYNIADPDTYDPAHPELFDRDDISPKAGSDHGTGILGIIGSNDNDDGITGLASGAGFCLGAMNNITSNPYPQDVSNAYYHFDANGTSVMNGSYGKAGVSLGSAVYNAILDLSVNGNNGKGIVFVFGAGNDGVNLGDTMYGAAIDQKIILVGALTASDERQSYSNYGNVIDIFVPDSVYTATLNNGYRYANGTSTATAIVTSVVTLAQEARPDINSTVIMNLMCKTADHIGVEPYDIPDENGNLRSATFGCGKLNADSFISEVEGY